MADRQIKAIMQGLTKVTEKVMTKVTVDITANLIETTPVLIGWARANWVPTIGTPYIANLSGKKPLAAGVQAAVAEQAEATAKTAAGYKLNMGSIFISNNVPYIIRLNEGSSKKAPAAFVQRAIHKAVTKDIKNI